MAISSELTKVIPKVIIGVPAWERSVGRPSRNRLENGHANRHRYRITTPVRKMHLDRVATRSSPPGVLAGRLWALESQTECRSRVGTRACVSAHRPTPPHRSGTADASFDSRLGAKRRPGWLTPAKSPLREHAGIAKQLTSSQHIEQPSPTEGARSDSSSAKCSPDAAELVLRGQLVCSDAGRCPLSVSALFGL